MGPPRGASGPHGRFATASPTTTAGRTVRPVTAEGEPRAGALGATSGGVRRRQAALKRTERAEISEPSAETNPTVSTRPPASMPAAGA